MLSENEEIDYPDYSSESQSSPPTRENPLEMPSPPSEGSLLKTRNRTYPKTELRKNRVPEEGNPSTTHPAGKNLIHNKSNATPTSNYYQSLQQNNEDTENNNEDPEDNTEQTEQNNEEQQNQTTKKRPPLIVLHQRLKDPKKTVNMMKTIATSGFSIKHGNNTTNIQLNDKKQAVAVSKWLELNAIAHHTFTSPEDKNHAFVLEGLDEVTTEDEIKEELNNDHHAQVKEVYRMKNTRTPKFLIITTKDMTMTKMTKIKILNYTRIQWRRYYNKWEATQCRRCLRWGHATSNCKGNTRCSRCAAEGHAIQDCKQPTTVMKCANCNRNDHPARSEDCPIYRAILEKKHARYNQYQDQQQQQQYIPAPPPQSNAWETRRYRHEQHAEPPREESYPELDSRTWPVPGRSRQYVSQAEERTIPSIQSQQEQIRTTRPQQTATYPEVRNENHFNLTNNSSNNSNNLSSTLSDLNELSNEISTLNTHVNIKRFIRNLKQLNAALAAANDEMQKLDIMINFSKYISRNGC